MTYAILGGLARARMTRVVTYRGVRRRHMHTLVTRYRELTPPVTVTTGTWTGPGDVNTVTEVVNSAVEWFSGMFWQTPPATVPPPSTPVTPPPAPEPAAATPSGPGLRGPENNEGSEQDEMNWVATDVYGTKIPPGMYACMHRSDNTAPEVLFKVGLPSLPGGFDLKAHQERSGERSAKDALYGGTVPALWGDNMGPLSESGGRYMLFMMNVWGVEVGKQQTADQMFDVIEMEVAFRMVPARKIVCVLDKKTGKVSGNPALPKPLVDEHVDRLERLFMIGKNRGFLPVA